MKPNIDKNKEDEEQLLPLQQNFIGQPQRRRLSLCKIVLIAVGLLVLFSLGIDTGLLAVWRISALGDRLVPSRNNINTTAALPVLGTLPNLVLPHVLGTNSSTNFIGPNDPSGFSLTGDDFEAALSDPSKQPALPKTGSCFYSHQPYLTATTSSPPLADFRRVSGRVEIADVLQGAIGDCGLGASVIALICNGQQEDLRAVLERDVGRLIARFLVPSNLPLLPNVPPIASMKTVRVLIDDGIAAIRPSLSQGNCHSNIGFLPSFDNGRPVVFMALLEKAWAKFLDANPVSEFPQKGYNGLAGTVARHVLQSFSGGNGRLYERFEPGFDLNMAAFLIKCINLRRACVVGTPPPTYRALGTNIDGRIETLAGAITPR
ncbi:hypothetical protein H2201_008891 [Coniosporium apollinis]|uniref:Calpain catalytic domain-containing protein n=1 Tax=Coniosporium apollinis TaxID=61459 RepID=A0ABQ9NH09_9PEZI|nr:hypothetical protein H2201_008891 [Coniosporium apollinis]